MPNRMALVDPIDAAAMGLKPLVITDRDLVFYCPHCRGELVVDRDGVGLELECPHCKRALVIPAESEIPSTQPASAGIEPAPAAAASLPDFDFSGHSPEQITQRSGELSHQLKENQSQDMEMRGHINRATIELHRLQIKLKKLQDRKMTIEAELNALRSAAAGPS